MIYNQKPPSKHTLKEENDHPFRIEDKHFEFQYFNTSIITRAYLQKQKQKQTSNIHSTSIVTIIFWGEKFKKKGILTQKAGSLGRLGSDGVIIDRINGGYVIRQIERRHAAPRINGQCVIRRVRYDCIMHGFFQLKILRCEKTPLKCNIVASP